jgi:hypothetical protein
MPTIIKHRKVNILILEFNDSILEHCRPGDIAIVHDDEGWWTKFVGEKGQVDSYDIPFDSYNKALWAAKAAAEFGF